MFSSDAANAARIYSREAGMDISPWQAARLDRHGISSMYARDFLQGKPRS